jgi:DNA-binding transcriptional LysR family regulator
MDLDQLKLFVDIVREQSFTKGGARNFVSQPAVTQSMRKLEEELGTQLLERTTRKVLVTEDGQILYDYARVILDKVQEVRTILQERQHKVLGTVRLCTVHSVGMYELPASLKEFIRRYPEVNLHIDYRLSEQVYHAVLDGGADLGLVAYPEDRPGIVAVPFLEDELVVITNHEHPLARKGSMPLRELDGTLFVAFEPEIPTGKAVYALLREHGVHVRTRMQCDNIEILKKMVEVGLGISLVPLLSVRQETRDGTLSVVRIADQQVRRPLSIIYRKGRVLSRPQRAFVELLTQEGPRLLARTLAAHADETPVH